jgi:oleandomycin transport system permease protein
MRLARHSATIAWRNLIKTMRTPEQLLDVTLQPALFLIIFTYIFGGAIAAGSQHDYLQFLLPGLLGQAIALGGVAIGVNLNSDLEKGIFDRFRSLPIARSAPLVGAVMADIVRYALLVAVFLGFGYAIGFRAQTDVLSVAAACALAIAFALCFCWISVWVGMKARTSGAVQGIVMLLVFPLTFASNTFVKTDTLPSALQAVADNNPLSQLVSSVRGLLIGGPVETHVLWTFAWMAGLLAVFVPLALRAYHRRA